MRQRRLMETGFCLNALRIIAGLHGAASIVPVCSHNNRGERERKKNPPKTTKFFSAIRSLFRIFYIYFSIFLVERCEQCCFFQPFEAVGEKKSNWIIVNQSHSRCSTRDDLNLWHWQIIHEKRFLFDVILERRHRHLASRWSLSSSMGISARARGLLNVTAVIA